MGRDQEKLRKSLLLIIEEWMEKMKEDEKHKQDIGGDDRERQGGHVSK